MDGDRHPDDLGAAAEAWGSALSSGELYTMEFRLRRRDGIYRWHIARAVPIRDPLNRIERWVGSNTDIEEQKEAEAALRESDLRTRLALDSAEMGVWQCFVVDGRFVDLTGDDRALMLLGGRPGEFASFAAFAARIHPEDRARLAPAAQEALAPDGDGVLDLDYRVLGDDGEAERWVQARAQTVAGPGGLRLVGTVRDISHRKSSEEQQRLLAAELQHRIKNTLAMVNAIATQTLRGPDIADRRADFSARVNALARAHDMLMATTWTAAPLRSGDRKRPARWPIAGCATCASPTSTWPAATPRPSSTRAARARRGGRRSTSPRAATRSRSSPSTRRSSLSAPAATCGSTPTASSGREAGARSALQERLGVRLDGGSRPRSRRRFPLVDLNFATSLRATFSPGDGLLNPNALRKLYQERAIAGGARFLNRHDPESVEIAERGGRRQVERVHFAEVAEDSTTRRAEGILATRHRSPNPPSTTCRSARTSCPSSRSARGARSSRRGSACAPSRSRSAGRSRSSTCARATSPPASICAWDR